MTKYENCYIHCLSYDTRLRAIRVTILIQYKIEFNVIIKELKVIFTEDFNYHDVLKPINGREQPEEPPIIDFFQIELAHSMS